MVGKLIGQASRALNKINRLIADLLNTSRLREGQLALQIAAFDLSELVAEAVKQLQHETAIPLAVQADGPVMVKADNVRIEQVIANFINNAIKYAPGSRTISVTVAATENAARVTVTDQGPGIPAVKLPRIFDRYYRVDDSGEQYSGLGLGLYICAEIIRRHGGQIGADSEPGQGCSFWFTLPI
jgi:signal transduction histidine kinase